MNRKTKIWLSVAACLTIFGAIAFVTAMSMQTWDFSKLSTAQFTKTTYILSDSISDITLLTDTADVRILPAEDDECSVVCYESELQPHAVFMNNKSLIIQENDERKWYERITFFMDTPEITIYLPLSSYDFIKLDADTSDVTISPKLEFQNLDIQVSTGDISCHGCILGDATVSTSTGDIRIEQSSAVSLNLRTTTGDVTLKNVTSEQDLCITVSTGKTSLSDVECQSLISGGSTGKIDLKNVTATKLFDLERSTGDITFDACDAERIRIKTDTGDVTGTLLSEKVFFTDTDTGDVRVPKTTTGGPCEVETDTGDIELEVM